MNMQLRSLCNRSPLQSTLCKSHSVHYFRGLSVGIVAFTNCKFIPYLLNPKNLCRCNFFPEIALVVAAFAAVVVGEYAALVVDASVV